MLGGLGWIHIEDLNSRPGKFSTLGLESKKGCVECCPKNPGPAWCPVKRSLFLKGAGKTILYEVLGPNREQHCWWRVTVEFWPRTVDSVERTTSSSPTSQIAYVQAWSVGFAWVSWRFRGQSSTFQTCCLLISLVGGTFANLFRRERLDPFVFRPKSP